MLNAFLKEDPTNVTIRSLTERARNGNLVQRQHREYENDARAVTILAAVHRDPHVSTRQIEREIGIP